MKFSEGSGVGCFSASVKGGRGPLVRRKKRKESVKAFEGTAISKINRKEKGGRGLDWGEGVPPQLESGWEEKDRGEGSTIIIKILGRETSFEGRTPY